jgi:hypothetical protein
VDGCVDLEALAMRPDATGNNLHIDRRGFERGGSSCRPAGADLLRVFGVEHST